MIVEIVSTGDELTTGELVDTNGAWLASQLMDLGVRPARFTVLGDDKSKLAQALASMAKRADIVLVTGGLGPTSDDVTAASAALAFGDTLTLNPQAFASMEAFFEKRGWPMPGGNEKQAYFPSTAGFIENRNGTAPGFSMEHSGCFFYFMPGVPMEMRRMFRGEILPGLKEKMGGMGAVHRLVFTLFGLAESKVSGRLKDFERKFPGIRLGFRAALPLIQVKLSASPEQKDFLASAGEYVLETLDHYVVSSRGLTLEEEVGRLLLERGESIAVAESCTGGLIAHWLTDVPGSSDYFIFSGVTYANSAKTGVLGVDEACLKEHGAVAEETALEMALGARRVSGADWGLATSGIAGPGGGSPEKPVGTICLGLAGPGISLSKKLIFSFDDRNMNKRIFAASALNLLRQHLNASFGE